jgi:toxin ParE1/3/4
LSRCTLSRLAERDLTGIGDYIARDSPRRAITFVRELRARCAAIAKAPKAGALRPELGADIRVVIFGRHLIAYHEDEGGVPIDRVLHSARDLAKLFPD